MQRLCGRERVINASTISSLFLPLLFRCFCTRCCTFPEWFCQRDDDFFFQFDQPSPSLLCSWLPPASERLWRPIKRREIRELFISFFPSFPSRPFFSSSSSTIFFFWLSLVLSWLPWKSATSTGAQAKKRRREMDDPRSRPKSLFYVSIFLYTSSNSSSSRDVNYISIDGCGRAALRRIWWFSFLFIRSIRISRHSDGP